MAPRYIWQHKDWPDYRWDSDSLMNLLSDVRNLEGRITGLMSGLCFDIQSSTALDFMTAEILHEKKEYYEVLEKTTTGSPDITLWLQWFLHAMKKALEHSERTLIRVVSKSSFWSRNRDVAMNERQVKMVNKLWDGFDGRLTSSKWAKMTGTSQATALRDITDLIEKGILMASEKSGRSTHYLHNLNYSYYSVTKELNGSASA